MPGLFAAEDVDQGSASGRFSATDIESASQGKFGAEDIDAAPPIPSVRDVMRMSGVTAPVQGPQRPNVPMETVGSFPRASLADVTGAARRGGMPETFTQEPTLSRNPLTGAVEAVRGAGRIISSGAVPPPASRGPAETLPTEPERRAAMRGTSEVLGGTMQATAPFVLPESLLAAPISTLTGLGVGTAAGAAAQYGAKKAGFSPEAQELAGTAGFFLPSATGALIRPRLGVAFTPEETVIRGGVAPIGMEPRVGEMRIPRGPRATPAGPALEPPTIEGQLAEPTREEIANAQQATNYAGPNEARAAHAVAKQAEAQVAPAAPSPGRTGEGGAAAAVTTLPAAAPSKAPKEVKPSVPVQNRPRASQPQPVVAPAAPPAAAAKIESQPEKPSEEKVQLPVVAGLADQAAAPQAGASLEAGRGATVGHEPAARPAPPSGRLDTGVREPAAAGPGVAEPEKPFKYRSTQANIPADSEAHTALESARARISDSDLAGKGKDVGGNHLTVKYGLKAADDADISKLRNYLSSLAPFEATLGKTEKFEPTEQSDGAAVIKAPIEAKELQQINQELDQHADFKPSDFGEYKPHATVAYVKPEVADRYVGMNVTAGKKFTVNEIAITDREGKQELVKLGGKGQGQFGAGEIDVQPEAAAVPFPARVTPTQHGFDHSLATGPDIGDKVRGEKPPLPRATKPSERETLGLPPKPGEIGTMRVADLTVAPQKFQYKLSTDAEGVGTLLKETKVFNPDLAGVVSVWRDPADGKTYVVNGHHRWELARRTGQTSISVRHIIAANVQEARAVGARQNIAEGRGTPVDAAKFFRDTSITPADLEKHGISLGEATASQGLALSKLDIPIFNKVVAGDLRIGRGVAIGEATADPAEQKAILSLVEKRERGGGKVSDGMLSELIRLVKGSEQTTESTADLFGSQEISRSLALEKADISDYIKSQLGKDKKLFGFVAKETRAQELARAGNKIDVERSKEISTGAAQAEEVYNKLSARGGPIASILDSAARRLADGEHAATVKADAYQAVRAEISQTLGGQEGKVPPGLEAGAGRSEAPRDESGQPAKAVEPAPRESASLGGNPDVADLRKPTRTQAPEPTLPGMESVPAERAEAVAVQQGKDLTAKLIQPPKSIEAKAGEIEQKSPLFRDTEANPQEDLFGGESGAFTPAALNPARITGSYAKLAEKLISEKLKIGDKYWNVKQYDPDVADTLHLVDNAPRYLRAKAAANLKKVTEGLTEDQTRLAALMVDSDSRDDLQTNHPAEYQQAQNDSAVMDAVHRFKPLQDELTANRQALGWPVRMSLHIEEDPTSSNPFVVQDRQGNPVADFKTEKQAEHFVEQYATVEPHLKRTYPEHSKSPLPADTGAGPATGSFYADKGLRPPKMDKKSREMSATYHYEHGRKDFSGYLESYAQAGEAMLKQNLFDQFSNTATAWKQGTAQPPTIDYHGEKYYRPDLVLKARQGGETLKPYAVYDPSRGERFLITNPSEGWATQTTGKPGIGPMDRFLGPKPVVDALENYDTSRGGEGAGKLRKFLQEQIVGLFGPMVHVNNIIRHLGQGTGTGAFDPRSWPSITRVMLSGELRDRMMQGVDDSTIDLLVRRGAYTDWHDIANLNGYIGGNFNPLNWIRGFGKGVLFDPKFAGGWGGLDPKARVVLTDFLKEHVPQMSEQQMADAVNDAFGNYNRANWTERQKQIARFTLFPGWDTASAKWFLRHPWKVGVAGALVVLAANLVMHKLGLSKGDDWVDTAYLHWGDRKLRTGVISDSIGQHAVQPALSAAEAAIKGEDVAEGATQGAVRGAAALAGQLAGPSVEMVADQLFNRKYAGGVSQIVEPEDKNIPGTWAPNREIEKRIAFAALKGLPALSRFINPKGQWDWKQGLGSAMGVTNYKYGAEERLKASVAKSMGYSQTLSALAEREPEAAQKFVADPSKAVYLMFHNDLDQMAKDLKELDKEKERVAMAGSLSQRERKEILGTLDSSRKQLLIAADALDDALTSAKLQMKKAAGQ
jgi:2'-5' RNA ligase